MSSFKPADRLKFEKLFCMKDGYVLRFTNKTFRDIFARTLDIDIYDGSWAEKTLSKANLLRSFWGKASDFQVATINRELLRQWYEQEENKAETDIALYKECVDINSALFGNQTVRNIEALSQIDNDGTIEAIVRDIKHNIETNNPELTLDRLHSYLISFGRELCQKHGIDYQDKDTLNSIFRLYNKWLHDNELLESKMSSKIIGSAVKLLEDFNYVRNNQSAAHPNPLLNKIESLFIVDTICSIVEFINKVENVLPDTVKPNAEDDAQLLI